MRASSRAAPVVLAGVPAELCGACRVTIQADEARADRAWWAPALEATDPAHARRRRKHYAGAIIGPYEAHAFFSRKGKA